MALKQTQTSVITQMRSFVKTKEILKLIGQLIALSRFVPKFGKKTKLIVQLLRKARQFNWNPQCEEIFLQSKTFLAAPRVIQKSDPQRPIFLYLSVSNEAFSATLVQEVDKEERPIYFISRILHGSEIRY